jgi:hypothetical protein
MNDLDLPSELTARVTVKVGHPYSNSRTVHGNPFNVRLVVAEGYRIFRERIKRQVATMTEIAWSAEGPLLLRPSANAPQSRYEPITDNDDEFKIQLQRKWRHAGRSRQGFVTLNINGDSIWYNCY